MIAQPDFPPRLTPQEYLDWEAQQDYRYEYIDGEIIAMTGGTIPHNDLALNFYRALYPHLRQRGCRANVSDVKVEDSKNERYFYPDLVVTCDAEDLQAQTSVKHPTVIVEVLSPSTATGDRSTKLKCYRQIPTVQEYVLVDSQSMTVELYRRGDEGRMWGYAQYEAGERFRLESLDFELELSVLYEGVNLNQ
ncbi:Uma2 family endonuclease [Sodalinema gerasimenkoae]|uniref:Uma2 family endonuclease n=1 Tax=Sodalinema gerasimenkoae TaxID=2862348 RepID=UPI0013581A5C|nr:Uma2 family endonuclease [Sodalinema gerasimenkoae]